MADWVMPERCGPPPTSSRSRRRTGTPPASAIRRGADLPAWEGGTPSIRKTNDTQKPPEVYRSSKASKNRATTHGRTINVDAEAPATHLDHLGCALMGFQSASPLADEYVDKAKAYIARSPRPAPPGPGRPTGPKAQGKRLVVFVELRPAQQRRARRRRVRRRGGQDHGLGLPRPRRAGHGLRPDHGAEPGDRAQARRDHPRLGRRHRA